MARIFPQWIPQSEREANPGRRAEYLVYDHLAQLSDHWLVLYGAAIKWAHRYGVSDREADFIIAHPDLGVVVIEVKGGSISREGGIWYSTPLSQLALPKSEQRRHDIKNPYQQATDAAKAYERKLDEYIRAQRLPDRAFKIGTAVCFPDIELPPGLHLAGDALPELTLDRGALADLPNRLYQILKLYQGQGGQKPGQEGLDLLAGVLARDWRIESYLAYEFESVEQRYKQLTEEQFQILYSLEDNPRMLIRGCAGSGKTMLAEHKAKRLADQGLRVLLTCYNHQLAAWLQERPSLANRRNLRVTHFHGLCRQAADAASEVELPEWSPQLGVSRQAYYKTTMPEALELAAIELGLTFDAIIVDEGQDFQQTWLEALHGLLADADQGIFYLFYDDNQRVYKKGNVPFQWPSYRLTRNMRNTNPIFDVLMDYYDLNQKVFPSGVSGPEPLTVPLGAHADEYEAVQEVLERLSAEGIPPSQVAILTPRDRRESFWGQLGRRSGKFTPVWQLKPTGTQVTCSSIRTFKGLERPVIILTELGRMEDWQVEQLMYVAISRAKTYLVVIGDLPTRRLD
jgi:hypothetical protein